MKIFVKCPNERRCTLEVDGQDTVSSLKAKVSDKTGYLYEQQRLIYLTKQLLEDEKTLAECGIEKDATVTMILQTGGVVLPAIPIRIKTLTGQQIAVEVKNSDTIDSVKRRLDRNYRISASQNRLVYNGQTLENRHLVSYYRIRRDEIINVIPNLAPNMKITVTPVNHKEMFLNVHSSDKVGMVKFKIETESRISWRKQQLIFGGCVLEDDCSLNDCNVLDGSSLDLIVEEDQQFSSELVLGLVLRISQQKQEISELSSSVAKMISKVAQLEQRLSSKDAQTNAMQQEVIDRMDALEERLSCISRDEVTIDQTKVLGHGAWGTVYAAKFRGRTVAAKVFDKMIVTTHNKDVFRREMKIFSRLQHPNLIEFIAVVPTLPAIILLEVMDTDLRNAILQHRIKSHHVHRIAADIATVLNYLHSIKPNPIIHRDVSAPNVLLRTTTGRYSTEWIVKLADFGSAQFVNLAQSFGPGCALYAAPEMRSVHSSDKQTVKVDVYSYGVLLIELFTNELPTRRLHEYLNQIHFSNSKLASLIDWCTKEHSMRRPSMNEVLPALDQCFVR